MTIGKLQIIGAVALSCAIAACDQSASIAKGFPSGKSGSAADAPQKRMGFVLTNVENLHRIYDGDAAKADCPDGFQHSNREGWERQFPTKSARQAHLARCWSMQNRGPNCENVWFNPEAVEDSVPFREAKGKVALGLNLDGTPDGRATAKTCEHAKFVGPNGEPGIDNQAHRFFGCERFRRFTVTDSIIRYTLNQKLYLRILLEVSGVDSEENDDAVDVTMYWGKDEALVVDAADRPVPWQSQRIDEGPASVIARVRGRIKDGVLITEPTDARRQDLLIVPGDILIRSMSLHLKLTPTGAEGLQVGYLDIDQLWETYKRAGVQGGTIYGSSPPSTYAALRRLADGYKDPRTGMCTAMSSAERWEFVRVNLVEPGGATR